MFKVVSEKTKNPLKMGSIKMFENQTPKSTLVVAILYLKNPRFLALR
jgi:hypothetical protein